MYRKYIVETNVGDFETYAATPAKAISNIRYRLFGRTANNSRTLYWTVKEAA